MISINIGFGNIKWTLFIMVLAFIFYWFFIKSQVKQETDALADVAKKWILMIDPKCPFCEKQLQVLGPKKHMFKILDVNKDAKLLKKLKLPTGKGVPLWCNTQSKQYKVGLLQMEDIKRL